MRGNNLLRRFLLAHHRLSPNGKPLVLPVLVGSWGGSPAKEHLQAIDRIVRRDLPIELYWIDAECSAGAVVLVSGNWKCGRICIREVSGPISRRSAPVGSEAAVVVRAATGLPRHAVGPVSRPAGWLLELKAASRNTSNAT